MRYGETYFEAVKKNWISWERRDVPQAPGVNSLRLLWETRSDQDLLYNDVCEYVPREEKEGEKRERERVTETLLKEGRQYEPRHHRERWSLTLLSLLLTYVPMHSRIAHKLT